MTAARKAWVLSLAVHTAGLGALGVAWGTGASSQRTMEIVDVRVGELGSTELVMLEEPVPQSMPTVTALPLPQAMNATSFEPVIPAMHREPVAPNVTNPAPRAHAPASTPGVATTFFGVPAVGKSVVYVIDKSASMGLTHRLSRAVREVEASLQQLPAGTQFQVIAYARTPVALRIGAGGLIAAGPDAHAEAGLQLSRLAAEGGTDHVRALKTALLLHPDVIYFLTDEDDLTPADVTVVTEYNRGRSSIHTICMVAPSSATTPIQELARRNRGVFRTARQ